MITIYYCLITIHGDLWPRISSTRTGVYTLIIVSWCMGHLKYADAAIILVIDVTNSNNNANNNINTHTNTNSYVLGNGTSYK